MASNSFGTLFRITTWGESHGRAVGVVIDGCPSGIELSEEIVNRELAKRAPGKSPLTSPRREPDLSEIYSGVFEGKTTGAPISIIIPNKDVDSSKYEPIRNLYRPGHAAFTYLKKYGVFDYRGGGRASARETVGRVAAGAVAKEFLKTFEIVPQAKLIEVGGENNPARFAEIIERAKEEGDSVGGVIEGIVSKIPIGLGEPIYQKIESQLAQAMLSLPASKGFEMGDGFQAARMRGSKHNDSFINRMGIVSTETNHSGGTLGGITNGMPLIFRIAFKPTSSILHPQKTVTIAGDPVLFSLPEGSRHDPCVAVRAVPIVEAMTALVLADLLLMDRSRRG